MRILNEISFAAAVTVCITAVSSTCVAQAYPTKPIRILVAFSPGAQTDIIARIMAPKMNESWGQPVIVENRPGGAGAVAGSILVNAAPDGHTLKCY